MSTFGVVLYQCTGCGSFHDVDIESHVDETIYFECECGEKAEPVSSPSALIVSMYNAAYEVEPDQ